MIGLAERARERILAHAREAYPEEACGLLLGRDGAIVESHPARNVAAGDRRRSFELDPADFVAADSSARDRGLEILGSYHSHPDGPAEPSEADRSLAGGGWLVAILGRSGQARPELRAWRSAEGRWLEVPIGPEPLS